MNKKQYKKKSLYRKKPECNENIIQNSDELPEKNIDIDQDCITPHDSIIKENLNDLDIDQDYIRPPDSIIKERLIDFDEDNIDDEIMMAINISKQQYYENNMHNQDISHIDKYNDEQLLKGIEISNNEILKYEEYILNESIELEKKKRIESLTLFCKKIKTLVFTKEDLLIKKYIESVLDDYFNLKIDYINIEENMYNKIYSIIDTYYLLPIIKNYKKTSISEIEDNLVRNIFRKK